MAVKVHILVRFNFILLKIFRFEIVGKLITNQFVRVIKCLFYIFIYQIYPMNEFFFNEIRNGNFTEVNAMLKQNPVLLHSKDQRGSSPLILATYYDQLEIVELLLNSGAKIDMKDASGNTALMGVCFKGYEDIAKILIDKGANVNEQNSMGATALIYAATFNRANIAKLLLEHGADKTIKDVRGKTALEHAEMQAVPSLIALFKD